MKVSMAIEADKAVKSTKPAKPVKTAKTIKAASKPAQGAIPKPRKVAGGKAPKVEATGASLAAIDEFCDTLWLEDGLAKNSLEAYRRDMTLFAHWLQTQRHKDLLATTADDLNAYFAARHGDTKASSANRRLAVLKRFFLLALRQNRITEDPCLRMKSAKQPPRFPKILSEGQVDALLAAPDVATPLGLRDRTMLELMYASGLRVSELVSLKTFNVIMSEGVLRVLGKGSKERLVPFGLVARDWITRYLSEARPLILGGQQTEDLFVTARGQGMSRVMFWI